MNEEYQKWVDSITRSHALLSIQALARIDALDSLVVSLGQRLGLSRDEITKQLAEAEDASKLYRLAQLEDQNPSLAAELCNDLSNPKTVDPDSDSPERKSP